MTRAGAASERLKGIWVLGVVAVVAGAAWVALGATPRPITRVAPHPCYEYENSAAQVAAEAKRDGHDISAACVTRLLSHNHTVGRVAVLLHGFTSCPRQFERFGQLLYEQGWNVLIPRLPRHGLSSRMTDALARLSAEELVGTASHALDLAHGFGDTVTVVGFSQGGVVAAYLAQNREDLDQVMIVAPSLAPHGVSQHVAMRLTNALLIAPNFYRWWDAQRKEDVAGPQETYPRYPTRALGEIYRLGVLVVEEASHRSPSAGSIVVVTNASDTAVNNEAVGTLENQWREHGGHVRTFEFPRAQGLEHDLIDPEQPYQRVDEVYPVLRTLISG
jgi:esterase/lipase